MEVVVIGLLAYIPFYWVMRQYKIWHFKAQRATEEAVNATFLKDSLSEHASAKATDAPKDIVDSMNRPA